MISLSIPLPAASAVTHTVRLNAAFRRIAWLTVLSLLLHLFVAGLPNPFDTAPATIRNVLHASLVPAGSPSSMPPAAATAAQALTGEHRLTDETARKSPPAPAPERDSSGPGRPLLPPAMSAASQIGATQEIVPAPPPGTALHETGSIGNSQAMLSEDEPRFVAATDTGKPGASTSATLESAPPPDVSTIPLAAMLAANFPGPAQLHYRLTATDPRSSPAKVLTGNGLLSWELNGQQYQLGLRTQINVLMVPVTALTLNSDGQIDGRGLLPVRYTETRRGKAPRAINFNRDQRQSITFSASDKSLPLSQGAQDRLSILLQLSGWMRADPQLGKNGNRIEMFVAGVRGEGEIWRFSALGKATVETTLGPLRAWHFKRVTRPDSNDRGVEVWLAPEHGGYPARILFIEPNSTRIDLVLERIEQGL